MINKLTNKGRFDIIGIYGFLLCKALASIGIRKFRGGRI